MNITLPTSDNPVTVIQGDCLDVLRQLPDGCVDAVVTDPPYLLANSGVEYAFTGVSSRFASTKTVGDEWGYHLSWVDDAAKLNPNQWLVFASYKMLGDVMTSVGRYAEVCNVFVWRKPNAPRMVRPVPRLDCEFIVWAKKKGVGNGRMGEFDSQVIDMSALQAGCMAGERILKPGSGQAAHPCQKPAKLLRLFISRMDCESILDPFAGSGTTGVAAMREGRRAILIEKEPAYVDIINNRLSEKGTLFAGA